MKRKKRKKSRFLPSITIPSMFGSLSLFSRHNCSIAVTRNGRETTHLRTCKKRSRHDIPPLYLVQSLLCSVPGEIRSGSNSLRPAMRERANAGQKGEKTHSHVWDRTQFVLLLRDFLLAHEIEEGKITRFRD